MTCNVCSTCQLKEMFYFWKLCAHLDSRWSPGVTVGTASAVRSGTVDGDPCECKPISVGAAASHPRSSSHPHPSSWVAPVGLCSEPDLVPEPATDCFCKESSHRSARSAFWAGSLCYYTAVAPAREGWVQVERQEQGVESTVLCM